MDSLVLFGAKRRAPARKARKSPVRKSRRSPARKVRKSSPKRGPMRVGSVGSVVVRGRERKLYRGKLGGLYYKTKSGKTYVDAKEARKSARKSPKRKSPVRKAARKSPKRKSPVRKAARKSPKRRSPVRKARRSPVRKARRSPARKTRARKSPMRRMRYGYGLGQPSLMDMMGPAGLSVATAAPSSMREMGFGY